MCGACGRPHDPDGARVAGPRRRAAVARAATRLDGAATPRVTVRPMPGGWTVARPTGRTVVVSTLADLVDVLAPADPGAARRVLLAAADRATGTGESGREALQNSLTR